MKYVDFGLDQIDIKRKFVKKYGENIVIRLKFTKDPVPAPTMVANVADTEGVELVVRDGAAATEDV